MTKVRILKSLVFSLSTTVRGIRDSLREADQTFSVRLRIIGSVSDNGTSCSKVSSAEIDLGGLFGTTWRCRGTSHRDARHSWPSSIGSSRPRRLLTVFMPSFSSFSSVTLPTPGKRPTRQWQQKCTHLLWLNHEESIRLPPV